MPARILIVDEIATNRVFLTVKLTAANYEVVQAASGAAGLELARKKAPDMVLCAARLPDMDATGFLTGLRALPGCADRPTVVLTAQRDCARRLALLDAGADEVLAKPWSDDLLLARLRSLLRQRETEEEGRLREGAARAMGLAEEPAGYAQQGRVTLIAPEADEARRWAALLAPHLSDELDPCSYKSALRRLSGRPAPDAILLVAAHGNMEPELRLIADLRANPATREAGLLVVVSGDKAQTAAAEALDRGANDTIALSVSPAETALRLRRQIARKRRLDRMRAEMAGGLQAALTDPLTGLFNRRHAMPHLAAMARNAEAQGADFAAMVVDIDYFKLVNDRFGHAAGDAVLQQLAQVLQAALHEGDLLARIGGEEFLVALPETGPHRAQLVARRLCRAVRETAFKVPGRERGLRVTVSIGVALASDPVPEGGREPAAWRSAESVLARADRALYGAKAHGRNQVTFCDRQTAA